MSRYTIQQQAAIHKDMPPLAADDHNLVLDVDFRLGQAAVEAILETTEGLSKIGTPDGEDYDSIKGLNPNGTFGWRVNGWTPSNLASRANMYDNDGATIFIEVERRAVASTWKDDTGGFIDNSDGPSINDAADFTQGVTAYRQLFDCEDGDASPYPTLQAFCQVTWSGANPLFRLIPSKIIDTAADQIAVRFNPHAPSQMGDFVRIALVLNNRAKVVDCYLDDRLVNRATWDETFGDDANKTDIFKRLVLLARYGGNSYFKGYVKRFQIINRACSNQHYSGHKVAFIGDSIVVRSGGGYADEAAINSAGTVAALDAVQSALSNAYAKEEGSASANPVMGYHYCPWATMLSNLAAYEGAPFHYYIAGDSGSEWSTENSDQIAANRFNAVIAYNPEIIVCLGSVNDVAVGNTTAQLETDTKDKLDDFIDNCPNLNHILFLTTPPLVGDDGVNTSAKRDLLDSHHAMQAGLNGYRGKVVVYDLFTALGGHDMNGDYNEGSHTNAADWDAISSSSIAGDNIHPGQTGMSKYAEVIWPVLKSLLYVR